MANFNPKDYETVAERLKRFLEDHPYARIQTTNLTTPEDRAALTWVTKTEIYLPIWTIPDLPETVLAFGDGWYLKATGHAFEIDGVNGMANKTSALENCETSSLGRALANAGYGGDRRITREEAEKVVRGVTPSRDWIREAKSATDLETLRKLYSEARRASVGNDILKTIEDLSSKWTTRSEES